MKVVFGGFGYELEKEEDHHVAHVTVPETGTKVAVRGFVNQSFNGVWLDLHVDTARKLGASSLTVIDDTVEEKLDAQS